MQEKSLELSDKELQEYAEEQNRVVYMYVKGYQDEREIQKVTGLPLKRIQEHLKGFKEYTAQDKVIRERAKETVLALDFHFASIMKDLYQTLKEADNADDYKQKTVILKTIADTESRRMELLQKAGLVADNTLGDQLAEQEKKQTILVDILKDIAKKHPEIAKEIASRLSKVTSQVEPVRVISDN